MKKQAIANRTQELAIFQSMVSGESTERIFLIEAASGMGKSDLLKKFQAACATTTTVIPIDLKGAEIGIPYLFNCICEDLGYEHFPTFAAALRQMVSGAINFSNNQMEGEQTIQIALNVDETTRKYRLSELQKAFFQDLRAIDRTLVLLLDTFQAAVTELQNWIASDLLRMTPKLKNLVVVVAGQSVPDPNNIAWSNACEHCCLDVIHDEEAWYHFAQEIGLSSLEKPAIKMLVRVLSGNPRNIRLHLEQQARSWHQ